MSEENTYTIKPLYLGKMLDFEKSVYTYRTDYGVKMDTPFMAFLIQGKDRNILVDTGPKGIDVVKKNHSHVNAEIPEGVLVDALAKNGLKPEDIDFIICTHLHWDHCQNNDCFPGKKVYVQRIELQYAACPLEAQQQTYESPCCGMIPKWATAGNVMVPVDGDCELDPGIEVFLTPGHTPGSQIVRVNTSDGKYIIAGDTANLYENWYGNDGNTHVHGGIHVSLEDVEESNRKIEKLEFTELIPSHDMKVLDHEVYPYK